MALAYKVGGEGRPGLWRGLKALLRQMLSRLRGRNEVANTLTLLLQAQVHFM